MLDESSAVASNKRSESFQGNLPKLEIQYFEIQWFYNTAGSGSIKKWLLGNLKLEAQVSLYRSPDINKSS